MFLIGILAVLGLYLYAILKVAGDEDEAQEKYLKNSKRRDGRV